MGYIAREGDVVKSSSHTYKIVKEINKGGFADAYKAVDENKQVVFLKQYKSPSKLVPWFKSYFSYEAELNRRLKNDPILQNATIYANEVFLAPVYKSDGYTKWTRNESLFQVFPFVSGNTDLSDMIEKGFGKFDWEKRFYACTVFAFALRKLHDADIVHCDLKPENIQVRLDNSIAIKYHPLLIDMDWSILSDKKAPWHGKQGYVGTPGYSSPEHLKNQAPLEASDVFTAGIIFCQVLADKHPFGSKLNDEDFNGYVLSGECDFKTAADIPFKGGVSDKFRQLVFDSLNVNPKKRPTMTDIHLEMMNICKKMKTPGGLAGRIAGFFSKPVSPKKEEPVEIPVPKKHVPREESSPSLSATLISVPTSSKGVVPVTISGDCGKITTTLNFVFDQNALRRLSSNARFADNTKQFTIHPVGSEWFISSNEDASNHTCLNGKILTSADTKIEAGKINEIELKGKASGKTVPLAKITVGFGLR